MAGKYKISRGHSRILGSTVEKDGVNFAIWCPDASEMELLLFSDIDDIHPESIILKSAEYKSHYYWHVLVHGIRDRQLYGWRVKNLVSRKPGTVFDPHKVLLDPYARRIVFPENYNRTFSRYVGSNMHFCAKSVVIDMSLYHWGREEKRPLHAMSSSIIYEMHVAGFTRNPNSGLPPGIRGTYAGIIEKIDYLKSLGITAVELLPVFQFDLLDAQPGKCNYWGYSPMSFFAVHGDYSSRNDIYGPLDEFRDMVKALHRAGIEVFLDVVYNHTSEGDASGPIYSYKGLDNASYYILDPEKEGVYRNYTGCGNTVNASNPMVKQLIKDSLHFWTEEMHVDGFRFDLACVLSRDSSGQPLNDPPTTLAIDCDNRLSDVKLIAEPWDAGGLYQVGAMAGSRWREWNGQFRDDLRCFLKGDNGMISRFVNRILGSPDIYRGKNVDPQKSVNFVTCHDGFTLWDLVSYNNKHNEANGEDNRDGNDFNFSFNYGEEGETRDPRIRAVRLRQAKNFMLLNLMSMGTPMILMGDEVLRTQHGNNNAYCQDTEMSYLNWEPGKEAEEMLRFTRILLSYRSRRGMKHFRGRDFESLQEAIANNSITWHGVEPFRPDWSYSSHSIGLTVYSDTRGIWYYVFINAYWEGLHIKIPSVPHGEKQKWFRVIDTYLAPPDDIYSEQDEYFPIGHNYYLGSRSILVLVAPGLAE